MIQIKNIKQSYGPKQVLYETNLEINEHQITSLIGSNGAGKSTLLSVISKTIEPTSGEVLIDGVNLKDIKVSQLAKRVSILRQTNNISAKITVYDLITFGRFPHSKGRITPACQAKIDEAIKYLKLESIKDEYLDELSGGQRQRAFIAMVLAQDTKYILLDEPFNNLDVKYSIELMMILKNLVKDFQKTILLVMHDINFASAFSDRIVALKDGIIIKEGTPEEMMDKLILDEVFDHDFCIGCVNGKKVCIYYHDQHNEEIESLERTPNDLRNGKEGSL